MNSLTEILHAHTPVQGAEKEIEYYQVSRKRDEIVYPCT
jgi:hypothetical protein